MAQPRDNLFNPSSPHSSGGGAESFKGTPNTLQAPFSPEDNPSSSSNMLQTFTHSTSATPLVRHPVNNYRRSLSQQDKDPFLSPAHGTRLSPTATDFRPVFNLIDFPRVPDERQYATALSTDLGLSHHLDVSSSGHLTVSDVDRFLKDLAESGTKLHGPRQLESVEGRVNLHFADIRDACSIFSNISLSNNGWHVAYINPGHASKVDMMHPENKLRHLGIVSVTAASTLETTMDAGQMMEIARGFLETYGPLFTLVKQTSYADVSCSAIAQFCNPIDAVSAIQRGNGAIVERVHLTISLPDTTTDSACSITAALRDISLGAGPSAMDQHAGTGRRLAPTVGAHAPFSMYPFMIPAPMGPMMPFHLERVPQAGQISHMAPHMASPYPILGNLYQAPPSPALTVRNEYSPSRVMSGFIRSDARRQNATRISRSPYHGAANHHNHVDISRIRDGIDVRTTIMLRNIPNKVDQAMLKGIIDESSWGKYDFMYLRIDFANDCNVGYAFINFVDPLDIIDFVNARGNQRWNCFKSDKVAEISYATIQGKDCLVQKFRNSSVMLEAPHYRPKLYYTSNGPMPELAGQEEAFPEPDNQSKMKRSCENAEHVGLFTPNAGQHFRDEQRRRRSQYDRGTRLAALEEYDYEAAIQHLYGPGPQ